MPIVATKANAGAGGYGWSSAVAESLDGMVLITPTSVDKAGTGSTATIGANGSVTFSACTSLSLNGVFTSDYDNYMIVVRHKEAENFATHSYRMRATGTDNSTASSYVYQQFSVTSTSKSGSRTTSTSASLNTSSGVEAGYTAYIYGPYLAQPTAVRSVTISGDSVSGGPMIEDYASTHNQSTSYDGITIFALSAPKLLSGLVSVYGLEN